MAYVVAWVLVLHMMMGAAWADDCHAANVSAGHTFACALLTDGSVKCWGVTEHGELGRASNSPASDPNGPPLDFGADRAVVQLAAHSSFSCALLDNNSLACWGANDAGQLGLGDTQDRGKPTYLQQFGTRLKEVQLLSTGATGSHSCAAVRGDQMVCWGDAGGLQGTPWVGAPDSRDINGTQIILPSLVDLPSDFGNVIVQDMCTGTQHTCVLINRLGLFCWGTQASGAMGLGNITDTSNFTGSTLPSVNLGENRSAVQIACGSDFTCALLDDGSLKCFGSSSEGQTGSGSPRPIGTAEADMGNNLQPVKVGTGRTVKQVAAGNVHTCALLDNGQVKCWGDGAQGMLGHGNGSCGGSWGYGPDDMGNNLPFVNLTRSAVSITAGVLSSCAVLDDGNVKCWGSNSDGQLGFNSDSTYTCSPEQAVPLGSTCITLPKDGNISPALNSTASPTAPATSPPLSPPSPFPSPPSPSPSPPPVTPSPPLPPVQTAASSPSHRAMIGILAGSVTAGVLVLALIGWGAWRWRTRSTTSKPSSSSSAPFTGLWSEASSEHMRIAWSQLHIGRVLGEGGFGTVYKAKWQSETVAVKLLNMNRTNAHAIDSLHKEALIMSQLKHPCIARVYGVVDEYPNHALVMQYYPQGTLAKYMNTAAYASLDLHTRVHIARQIASGMRFMHERPVPVLHGDLKTANILLTGPGKSIVIADFGLSQAMLAGQEAAVASGALTYSISPPEVLDDPLAPRTRAADVYAFAIVLLEVVTGLPPYRGMRAFDIRRAVTSGARPGLPSDMPPSISSIIEACWSQDPASRPTFAQVTQQLTAVYDSMHLACLTDGTLTVDGTQSMADW